MESNSKIKTKNSEKTYKKEEENYLDKMNRIVKFIETDIAENKNNPFTGYNYLEHISNKEDFFDWEIGITNDGSINLENRFKWHMEFIKMIIDYGEKTNCSEIIEKIAFML